MIRRVLAITFLALLAFTVFPLVVLANTTAVGGAGFGPSMPSSTAQTSRVLPATR